MLSLDQTEHLKNTPASAAVNFVMLSIHGRNLMEQLSEKEHVPSVIDGS